MTFHIATRVTWDRTGSRTRHELQHSGDTLMGLPADMEDIELGRDVRAALFCENVFGLFYWEIG